jgi:hypothetical protein
LASSAGLHIRYKKMQDPETLLNDVMFMALDHGISSIADGTGPLIPFVITENKSGERTLKRFVSERVEEGVDTAKSHVDQLRGGIVRYAIAWDGYATVQGKKWDAVLVEAGDCNSDSAYLMIQRYERKGWLRKKNVPHGNPALIDRPPSRIK